jgi:hypothetical protein
MAKKRIAHNGEMGSLVTRSGYAIKARPAELVLVLAILSVA